MGCLVIQMARKHKHNLSLISENKLNTVLADETHPLKPEPDNRHIQATGLEFPIACMIQVYSHSFQQPFRHTNNKQADKCNTQQLEIGMQG